MKNWKNWRFVYPRKPKPQPIEILQVSGEGNQLEENLPPVDWTCEDIYNLVFAMARDWMDPQYDATQVDLHEVRKAFHDIFTASDQWERSLSDKQDQEDVPEAGDANYALIIEDDKKGVIIKGWIYDQTGLHEISVQECRERYEARGKGAFAIWPFYMLRFTIQEDLRKVEFLTGESSMALRGWRDLVVRKVGELEFESDPNGYLLMT